MRRQFRGRSEAFVRSSEGEQGFWPSYADMMSAVALILFFVMLLSYIQNLITGNKLENTQAALADTEQRLTATQTLLEETSQLLEEAKETLASTQAQLQSTQTELTSTQTQLQSTQTELTNTQSQLSSARSELLNTQNSLNSTLQQVQTAQSELSRVTGELDQANLTLAQQQQELASQSQQLSDQSTRIATQEASLAAADAELQNMRQQMHALAVLRLSIVEQIRDSMIRTIGDASKVSIGESGNIILSESILFDSGKADIKPEAQPALDLLVDVFYQFLSDENNRAYVDSIIISGHTDWDGTEDANRVLSTDRANAVLGYLLGSQDGKLNSYSTYFCAAGYGETRPVASNYTLEGKAANRRIEISILLKDDSIMALVESLAGN